MQNRLQMLGFITCLSVGGCENSGPPESAPQGIELRISAYGEQRRDRVAITATVKNGSTRPIAWDRRFSVYTGWKVEDTKNGEIQPETIAILRSPAASEIQSRFVILQPGESYSHDFELTYLVPACQEGHATTKGPLSRHTPIFYEEIRRYRIPETVNEITVQLIRDDGFEGPGGFSAWFGQDPPDGLVLNLDKKIRSTLLTIKFR
jgi:hypothetical protein